MKKTILIVAFGFAILFSNAQTLMVDVGPTISKMTWDNSLVGESDYFEKTLIGIQTNIGVNYLNNRFFFLNSNIGYLRAGGDGSVLVTTVDNPEGIGTMDTKTKLNILSINTTINLKYTIKNKLTPYIGIGPKVDYLVSYDENVGLLVQFDESDNLNKWIYGIIGNIGINYELKKIIIGLEFDYNYNLNKLVDQSSSAPIQISNEINYEFYSLLFSIGYKIK